MSQTSPAGTLHAPLRFGRVAAAVLYLVFASVAARTLAMESIRPLLPTYLALELAFGVLYTAVSFVLRLPTWALHAYFACQSLLVLKLISLDPYFDFLILLFLLLSAQASLAFRGRALWTWVGVFMLLSGGVLVYYLGLARGLSLSLTTMAAEVIIPAYLIAYQENEAARRRSQALLADLQEANRQLQAYTDQVEELAAVNERNLLARALHDTTSQLVFSISLTVRSAQVLLQDEPGRLPEQLHNLEQMTGEALSQLRSLITRLRPPSTAQPTTPEDLGPAA